jgi:ABC-2 type transport system permease protein
MNKIGLIIQREYLTRVKKKSFLIMTILGPILMAALFIVPVYLAQMEGEIKTIGVLDETGLFLKSFKNTDNIIFVGIDKDVEQAKEEMKTNDLYALLYIPLTELSLPQSAKLYSNKHPNIAVKGYIKNTMSKELEAHKLSASGIEPDILKSIKTNINLFTIQINDGGEEKNSSTELRMFVGMAAGIIIYFFIFMYGAIVMRGVIEEKTNRIIEVIVSSVRPFQLMMGKIVGVAMVGLTQFVLWIVFTLIIVTSFLSIYSADIKNYESQKLLIQNESIIPADSAITNPESNEALIAVVESIASINFIMIILTFLFYFIGGYLLYAALFAAVGSAVDNETDTQQFMLPLTVPLILSVIMAQFIINNPDSPMSFWLSIFPLTSPVIMMVRIPFGVPYTELILSMLLLIAGFLGATWLAAKVYRTGILMYGKKVNYKELWKWIRYK